MARDLRFRGLILASLLAGACGDGAQDAPQQPEEPPRRPQDPAAEVDLAAMTPEQVLEAVLDECHGPLRGGMDRVFLYVREEGAEPLVVCAELPDKLRMEREDEGTCIALGDRFWECAPGAPAKAMEGEARRRLAELRATLDAATLGPLYRATAVERLAPDRYRLSPSDGDDWLLTLRDHTLIPSTLEGPDGTTRFVDYLRTSATWIPERVRCESGREFTLRFERHDVKLDELFFVDPESRPEDSPRAAEGRRRLVIGAEHHPEKPEPGENRAMFWLVLDDPGDWQARARLFEEHWTVLEAQQQKLAGFVAYCRDGDRELMVIPFRPADGDRPFVRPEGWDVRRKPEEQVLVVYPTEGDLETRIRDGERALREAVSARQVQPVGPVCAQPYLHLSEGAPEPEELRDVVVRMSVAVR